MSTTLPPINTAVMRHTAYSGDTAEDTVLKPDSVEYLKNITVPQLIRHIGRIPVAIIHSHLPRAMLTANALRSILIGLNYLVNVYEEYDLRPDSRMQLLEHAFEYMREEHMIPDDVFCLIITHNPMIEKTWRREIGYNGVIGHNNLEITGHL
jgi:hypothetical protein